MHDTTRRRKAAGAPSSLPLGEAELEQINEHTLRRYSAEELFAFRVTVCDNEVDRDREAFTTRALEDLARLLPGITMLMDHAPKAGGQCARIFHTEVVAEKGAVTRYGAPYTRLQALCYMPRLEGNRELVARIEAGILKEVSIGCAVRRQRCSICGSEPGACGHRKGRKYGEQECFVLLDGAEDAYEVSFVAVPAQVAAGVTKQATASLENAARRLEDALERLEQHILPPPPQADPPPPAPLPDEIKALVSKAETLVQHTLEGESQ